MEGTLNFKLAGLSEGSREIRALSLFSMAVKIFLLPGESNTEEASQVFKSLTLLEQKRKVKNVNICGRKKFSLMTSSHHPLKRIPHFVIPQS